MKQLHNAAYIPIVWEFLVKITIQFTNWELVVHGQTATQFLNISDEILVEQQRKLFCVSFQFIM